MCRGVDSWWKQVFIALDWSPKCIKHIIIAFSLKNVTYKHKEFLNYDFCPKICNY